MPAYELTPEQFDGLANVHNTYQGRYSSRFPELPPRNYSCIVSDAIRDVQAMQHILADNPTARVSLGLYADGSHLCRTQDYARAVVDTFGYHTDLVWYAFNYQNGNWYECSQDDAISQLPR